MSAQSNHYHYPLEQWHTVMTLETILDDWHVTVLLLCSDLQLQAIWALCIATLGAT